MKNKLVATVLAFFLGIFGVHRFYLGQKFLGVVYFLLFFIGLGATGASEGEVPVIMFPALLGFIDAILLGVMPKEEFDKKYNKQRGYDYTDDEYETYRKPNRKRTSAPPTSYAKPGKVDVNPHKRRGIEKYRNYDYEGAITEFQKALDLKYDEPSTHFNLACSYSIVEDANPAFFHLEKAVEFGFNNFKKIHEHDALAYLRSLPDFDDFVDNDYRQPETSFKDAQNDLLDQLQQSEADNLLSQIVRLGDLRDKGILTEEEFIEQKKKLLND